MACRLGLGGVGRGRRGKALSRQTLPTQSMTVWSNLIRGLDSARFGGNRSLIPTYCHRLPLGTALFIIKIISGAPTSAARGFGPESHRKCLKVAKVA